MQRPHTFPLDDADRLTALAARGLLAATLLAGLIGLLANGPIEVGHAVLQQADTRALGALPNAVNVLSHLPLLIVAALACRACLDLTRRGPRRASLWARGWALFFACVALGALGGAAFHAQPGVARLLVVDAAIGSASAVLALLFLAERINFGLLRGHWLVLAAAAGPVAALVAAASDDLRVLVALEFLPIVLVPLGVWRLPSRGMPGRDWIVAFAICVGAHVAAWADLPLWHLSRGAIGGLALSHLMLALCVAWLARCALAIAPLQPAAAGSGAAASNRASTSLTTSG
ncbi:hypothetical protein [Rivibacter subsaxonicus]|uniref:hypothetical protein n=1 Tax=Rivibacter subsaxonicus TaxID=457575 RepID=UPI00102CBF60|nr:hypothetical protein [Rivibacter subsaxonicus]